MARLQRLSTSIATLAICSLPLLGAHSYQEDRASLLDQWQYQRLGDTTWQACRVPSLVQENLIASGGLPDPFYRDNETRVQWPSNEDWVYRTTITLAKPLVEGERYMLQFDGIDTYSSVFLNGEKLGETANMFVGYEWDVSHKLRQGTNTLVVHLKSPLREAMGAYLSNGFNYPADNDHAPIRLSPFTRKAPYHYGWDWGMRLVTIGIWQPARLVCYREARLKAPLVRSSITWAEGASNVHTALKGIVHVVPNIESWSNGKKAIRLSLRDEGGQTVASQLYDTASASGHNLELNRPELWWPHLWGKPYLYQLDVELLGANGEILDCYRQAIGFREVELVQQDDYISHPKAEYAGAGRSFYFVVNRRRLFARGANYIPGDQILTRRGAAYFTRLFDDVQFANMNMIRVWGGGVYEDKRFYDEADRRGILVWQDFMFGCTAYPSDSAFLKNVKDEAEYQVRRLSNHTSLALWCGNNEVEEAIKYWGWQRKYSEAQYKQMAEGYSPLFKDLLSQVIKSIAPHQGYIHGSPLEANWGRPSTWRYGDSHYWGLWYGQEPFDTFEDKPMRFVSEYGFQAFPPMHSIRSFAQPEDYGLETPVMRLHQKASTGNGLIRTYMERDYRIPEGRFEDFVYIGQILQARGMAQVARTLRRNESDGALYWQLNDTWPSVSWSSVDYYGSYKAMHYTMHHAHANLAIATERTDSDSLVLYALWDDKQLGRDVELTIELRDFNKPRPLRRAVFKKQAIDQGRSSKLGVIDLNEWRLKDATDRGLDLTLRLGSGEIARLKWYPVPTKSLALPKAKYQHRFRRLSPTESMLTIKAETFLKDVLVEMPEHAVRMSDNVLDLFPGQEVEIRIRHKQDVRPSIRMMNDIHHPSH